MSIKNRGIKFSDIEDFELLLTHFIYIYREIIYINYSHKREVVFLFWRQKTFQILRWY